MQGELREDHVEATAGGEVVRDLLVLLRVALRHVARSDEHPVAEPGHERDGEHTQLGVFVEPAQAPAGRHER